MHKFKFLPVRMYSPWRSFSEEFNFKCIILLYIENVPLQQQNMNSLCAAPYWWCKVITGDVESFYLFNLYLTRQVSLEQILIYNDGLPRTRLCQLFAVLWDSQSRLDVMQPGFKPGTVATPLALRCSIIDHCATRESIWGAGLIFSPKRSWNNLFLQ